MLSRFKLALLVYTYTRLFMNILTGPLSIGRGGLRFARCRKEAGVDSFIGTVEEVRFRGYKTFFMLNSADSEIYPAHKC